MNKFDNLRSNHEGESQESFAQAFEDVPSFEAVAEKEVSKSQEEMLSFDDYVKRSAVAFSDFGLNFGYYEPEDGETPEDGYRDGLKDLEEDIRRIPGIENLYRNNVDIGACFEAGALYDAYIDFPFLQYSSDTAEREAYDSLAVLAKDYFGESSTQEDKELMTSIIALEPVDDGTPARHYELTDQQEAFLKAKNDVISHRILEDREGLSDGWKHYYPHVVEEAHSYYEKTHGAFRKAKIERILDHLSQVKKLFEKRRAAGIADPAHELESLEEQESDIRDQIDTLRYIKGDWDTEE